MACWGLGLFCIIKRRPGGEEVKSKKGKVKRGEGKGKRDEPEDGLGVGRDLRWIGMVDSWDWGFGWFGLEREGGGGEVKSKKGKGKRESPEDGFGARWGMSLVGILMVVMILGSAVLVIG